MTDVEIDRLNTTLEFGPEPAGAAPAVPVASGVTATDVERLKELLRPMILQVLGDEFDLSTRIGG